MHIEKVTTICLGAAPWGWVAALERKSILWVSDRSRGAGHNGGDGDGYQGTLVVSHPIEGEREHARLWKAIIIWQILCQQIFCKLCKTDIFCTFDNENVDLSSGFLMDTCG